MAVSPRAFSRLALANFIAFFAVIATGAAVRLTGSGLGCLDWPTCSMHRAIAPLGDLHAVIEDGNRAVSGLLVALTLVTIVAAVVRSPRRSDLVWLSAGLVLGVVADALLGAVVVYTKLNPWLVSVHMALSLATLVLAAVLHHRATHRYGSDARHDLRYPPSVVLARSLWVLLAATLLAGMVTTGSGPHSGSVSHDVVKFQSMSSLNAILVVSETGVAADGCNLDQTSRPRR